MTGIACEKVYSLMSSGQHHERVRVEEEVATVVDTAVEELAVAEVVSSSLSVVTQLVAINLEVEQ